MFVQLIILGRIDLVIIIYRLIYIILYLLFICIIYAMVIRSALLIISSSSPVFPSSLRNGAAKNNYPWTPLWQNNSPVSFCSSWNLASNTTFVASRAPFWVSGQTGCPQTRSINGRLHHEHAPYYIKLISCFSFFT
jgi:hypothetical protein